MSGRSSRKATPATSASIPSATNRTGNPIEGAGAALTLALAAARSAVNVLAAANVGDKTAIGLFFAFCCVTAFRETRVKMGGPPIRARAQFGIRRQLRQRFENRYQGLRRFQAARIDFHYGRLLAGRAGRGWIIRRLRNHRALKQHLPVTSAHWF